MQVFLGGGGSGGSILGDLGVKILKITDNQNVLGKVGRSLPHVVSRVQSMDIGARVSTEPSASGFSTRNQKRTRNRLYAACCCFVFH